MSVTSKKKEIVVEMDDPNFDVAVERAVAKANEWDDNLPGDEQSSFGELRFVGLVVTLRSHFGRDNHYRYTFEAE